MTHDDGGHWWESYLTLEEWAQMPASSRMWYNPDSPEKIEERQQTAHEMGLVAQGILLSALTPRQREVVELYCLEGRTQVEIANTLGISQATVSQHLMGKLRGGHHIGGALRKIRKAIRKMARLRAGEHSRPAEILNVFNELLAPSITRRRASEIIRGLSLSRKREVEE